MTVAVRPKPGPDRPTGASIQFTTPSPDSIAAPGVRLDQVARPQRREHRDDEQLPSPRARRPWPCRTPSGTTSTTQITVTAAATPMRAQRDRRGRRRCCSTARKLSSVNVRTTSPVKASVAPERREQQDGERAEVGTTSQQQRRQCSSSPRAAAVRVPVQGAATTRRRARSAVRLHSSAPWSALDLLPGRRPVAVVLAGHVGAAVEALGDRRGPVPDLVEVGLVRRRGRSSQKLLSAVSAHALLFDGASPNHSATSAFTFGLMI